MYSPEERDGIRDRVLQMAAEDPRVVSAAVVGSLALGGGDQWSDLDLSFAVADDAALPEVLEDWSRRIVREFGAAQLFDLASGPSIYRVFLLPNCLQLDISFTPAAQFGATSPRFKLLFGEATEKQHLQPRAADELFGLAVHHAIRGRVCLKRGRFWEAEYWVSNLRDYGLSLACRRRGLPSSYGRGFDDLPVEVRAIFARAVPSSLEAEELRRALKAGIEGLLGETGEAQEPAGKVEPPLRQLLRE